MPNATFHTRLLVPVLACIILAGGMAFAHAGTPDVAQQTDPKKKELTASVLRSIENETLTLNAHFPEESNNVKVALYNILGKLIELHPNTTAAKGDQTFRFTTRGLPSGPYIVVLESSGQRLVNKVMVSR